MPTEQDNKLARSRKEGYIPIFKFKEYEKPRDPKLFHYEDYKNKDIVFGKKKR
jgi:hypothetical protein